MKTAVMFCVAIIVLTTLFTGAIVMSERLSLAAQRAPRNMGRYSS